MKEEREKPKNTTTRNQWLITLLYIAGVVAVGMLAVNQTLGFFYKAHFLKSPCDLCADLNPKVEECIRSLNSPRLSFWDGDNWTDPFSDEPYYNIQLEEIK